jgi:predicted DNA-binding transcriptional regulator YafY
MLRYGGKMRASRLLSILITLQTHGRVTAAALAARFEVSQRTIYRDVDALSAAGVPIYADRGPGGGFALLDGYRTRLTGLTAAEAEAVLLMGLSGPLDDLGLGEAASAARLKLVAALPPAAGDSARRVGDRFHLDPVDWYRRAAPPAQLAIVATALWAERRLAIRYESWKGEVARTIDPLGLVLKAAQWYLVARADGDMRTYRVARILVAELLEQRFERPADFDLAGHWQREVARFEAELKQDRAEILVHPEAIAAIDRLGADVAQIVRAAQADADGARRVTIPIEGVAYTASLLLGFGNRIEVLAPEPLRAELGASAARIASLYREQATSNHPPRAERPAEGPESPGP